MYLGLVLVERDKADHPRSHSIDLSEIVSERARRPRSPSAVAQRRVDGSVLVGGQPRDLQPNPAPFEHRVAVRSGDGGLLPTRSCDERIDLFTVTQPRCEI